MSEERQTSYGGRTSGVGGIWRGCGRDRGGGRGGRGGRSGGRNDKKPQHTGKFIGTSSKMLGHVFQVNREQRKRGQFKDMLDMLKVYASENFAKDVRKMESLFGDDIKTPEINEPSKPKPKAGNKELTKKQEKIYDAKISAFVKEEKSMEDSLTVMYNITRGQCSAMMQNRLESGTKYERINAQANIAGLLKEISVSVYCK